MSITQSVIRTVIVSKSYIPSIYISCYPNSICETFYHYLTDFAFIIMSYSKIYTKTQMYSYKMKTVEKISEAQLIGATTGAAAGIFLIIGIIILAKNKKNYYTDYSYSIDSSSMSDDDPFYTVNTVRVNLGLRNNELKQVTNNSEINQSYNNDDLDIWM